VIRFQSKANFLVIIQILGTPRIIGAGRRRFWDIKTLVIRRSIRFAKCLRSFSFLIVLISSSQLLWTCCKNRSVPRSSRTSCWKVRGSRLSPPSSKVCAWSLASIVSLFLSNTLQSSHFYRFKSSRSREGCLVLPSSLLRTKV